MPLSQQINLHSLNRQQDKGRKFFEEKSSITISGAIEIG
jgi:hypothetical protein